MKRALAISLLLLAAGCGKKHIPPLHCQQPPAQGVTIDPAQVKQRYLISLQAAPVGGYTVCGTVPPGLKVVSQSGTLWLQGTPTAAGTYHFWIE